MHEEGGIALVGLARTSATSTLASATWPTTVPLQPTMNTVFALQPTATTERAPAATGAFVVTAGGEASRDAIARVPGGQPRS